MTVMPTAEPNCHLMPRWWDTQADAVPLRPQPLCGTLRVDRSLMPDPPRPAVVIDGIDDVCTGLVRRMPATSALTKFVGFSLRTVGSSCALAWGSLPAVHNLWQREEVFKNLAALQGATLMAMGTFYAQPFRPLIPYVAIERLLHQHHGALLRWSAPGIIAFALSNVREGIASVRCQGQAPKIFTHAMGDAYHPVALAHLNARWRNGACEVVYNILMSLANVAMSCLGMQGIAILGTLLVGGVGSACSSVRRAKVDGYLRTHTPATLDAWSRVQRAQALSQAEHAYTVLKTTKHAAYGVRHFPFAQTPILGLGATVVFVQRLYRTLVPVARANTVPSAETSVREICRALPASALVSIIGEAQTQDERPNGDSDSENHSDILRRAWHLLSVTGSRGVFVDRLLADRAVAPWTTLHACRHHGTQAIFSADALASAIAHAQDKECPPLERRLVQAALPRLYTHIEAVLCHEGKDFFHRCVRTITDDVCMRESASLKACESTTPPAISGR